MAILPDSAGRVVVGTTGALPPGSRRLVDVRGVGTIGVFNLRGRYYALKNTCPHQGGPLCRGRLTGTVRARLVEGEAPRLEWERDGEILRCPWHGWEFDVTTGRAVFGPGTRVATYEVRVLGTPQPEPAEPKPADPSGRSRRGTSHGQISAETYPVVVETDSVVVEVGGRASARARTSGERS